jgi:ATP-dependent Clp protease ATP-binding subunit ClpA
LKPRYEKHHKVRFTSAALKTAVDLSARYINDRKLPDKAIDVIDEAARRRICCHHRAAKVTIGQKEVEATVATMARIPPKHVSRDPTRRRLPRWKVT